MIKLEQRQKLNIGFDSYHVTGCISYQSGSDNWDEYNLKDDQGQVAWLSVDNKKGEFVLSHPSSPKNTSEFKLMNQGTATVTHHFGNTDVDLGDMVRYTEYNDAQDLYTYSVEEWEDEIEYSEGRYVQESEIQVLEVPPRTFQSTIEDLGSNFKSIGSTIIAVLLFILAPFSCFMDGACEESCKKCSPSDPNYAQCNEAYNSCVRARSIRQSSRRTRSSSGGGMHHGK